MISRIRNTMVTGIQEHKYLPKFVIVVIDDDLIRYINYPQYGISEALGKLVNWVMSEFNRIVAAQKDFLPKKARKPDQPHFMWIEAPYHISFQNNSLRAKFNRALQNMAKFNESHMVMQLKKGWIENDGNLFNGENRRYTVDGLKAYWLAVDKTVRYVDTIYLRKDPGRRQAEMHCNKPMGSRYHWKRNYTHSRTEEYCRDDRRMLPPPPK